MSAVTQDLFATGTLEELEGVLKGNLADARAAITEAQRTLAVKAGEIEAIETTLAMIGHAKAARDGRESRSGR